MESKFITKIKMDNDVIVLKQKTMHLVEGQSTKAKETTQSKQKNREREAQKGSHGHAQLQKGE